MKIFNTLSRNKEELIPLTPGEFKIYACGPTVYNFIHIGNARPLCVFKIAAHYVKYTKRSCITDMNKVIYGGTAGINFEFALFKGN